MATGRGNGKQSRHKKSRSTRSRIMRLLRRQPREGPATPDVPRASASPSAALQAAPAAPAAPAVPAAARSTAGGRAGPSDLAGPAGPGGALQPGAAASTPVRGPSVYNFEAGSVSPISHTGWRPTLQPRRALEPEPSPVEGRRIIQYTNFIQQIQADVHAGGFGCSFMNSKFVRETQFGFRSYMYYRCSMCNKETRLETDPDFKQEVNVNTALVSGVVNAGSTLAVLESVAAAVNMPCMSKPTYGCKEDSLADVMEEEAMNAMLAAGKEEYDLAVEAGDVSPDGKGTPFITAIVDGQWSKRSYKNKYDANSGSATIIGYRTGKVLWTATKNKRCSLCEHAVRKNKAPRQHACAKNYEGPSTGMEAAIILEGFRNCLEIHNFRILKYIGDGDSSVKARLQTERPYGPAYTVQKIECKNHLLRCFKGHLIALSDNTKLPCPEGVSKQEMVMLRKYLRENVLRLSTGVSKASEYRGKTEEVSRHFVRVEKLRNDILNAPCHTFGDHSNCAEYFCSTKQALAAGDAAPVEVNYKERLMKAGLWSEIMREVNKLASKASSLIFNVNNNKCEMANSVIAQKIANKRPYLSGRRSYSMRVHAAALSLNTSGQGLRMVHKSVAGGASPGEFTHKYIKAKKSARDEKRRRSAKRKLDLQAGNERPAPRASAAGPDKDYGLQVAGNEPPPADDPVALKAAIEEFKELLRKNLQRREELQRLSQGTDEWLRERANLLTASDFGEVCKREPTTSCRRFVFDKLYKTRGRPTEQMQHGHTNEIIAKEQLRSEGYEIEECGLFIDEEMPFLGASPDGLIGNDSIVEIKCPFTAYESQSTLQAIENKQIPYLDIKNEGNVKLKKDSAHYYQIQGQLHITKRQKCLFVVFTKHWKHVEEIERDDGFWNVHMRNQLERFYEEALVPEIVLPLYPYRYNKQDIRESPLYFHLRAPNRTFQDDSCLPPSEKCPHILKGKGR
ncbi:hypothetical protein KUF71_009550 [Frankliniella fusca]|uniref:YqaJ viral recombinase domain-containing protein n=1 Tax=Frankliniella fusca TaxID=407009 RepID=A0AAE1HFJ4_9NEOP|nr:hypothetical protein KUF71_009550 [Frankliniella fusca]